MSSTAKRSGKLKYQFSLPEGSPLLSRQFTFGVATSSFQIEGATKVDGRLPSIWDTFCNTKGMVKNGDNGDIACNHHTLWEKDLALLTELGVDAYRLSLSWVRLIKEDGTINAKGADFYKKILAGLQERGIKPFVTLYHWDLPQHLEDRGGWLSRECAYRFRDYVDVVTRALGEFAYSFATLNEPWCSAFLGYGYGVHAPGKKGIRNAKQAGHHLLLAHGLAMQVLRQNVPASKSGIVLNMAPTTANSHRYDDGIISQLAEAGGNHWFLEPLLEGKYPDIVNHFYPAEKPFVLDGDMEYISAPLDFLGINYYTRNIGMYEAGGKLKLGKNTSAEHTDFGWEIYPQGITNLLVDLHRQYTLPELLITENGASGSVDMVNGEIHDEQRCRYYDLHLNAIHNALAQGVRISGYFAWSLLDNFEWAEGYTKRFGLYHVDFASQQRTAKNSAKAFKEFLARRDPPSLQEDQKLRIV